MTRTIVVTGASSGVGRALAARAADAGYNVLAVARRADLLAGLAASAAGARGAIEVLALDLQAPEAPAQIAAAALRRFGRIDVLVNNAGAVAVGPIGEQSDAALREQFVVHVIAPLALVREALPQLRATKGQVLFVGSGVARVPVGGLGAYPSAKAAVRNAARIARAELRADGIAVTYVDPGAIDTEFMRRAGLAGAPPGIAVSPHVVARKILGAIATRQAVLNAVPWQAALVGLAELFPAATDALLARMPGLVGTAPPELSAPAAAPRAPAAPAAPGAPATPAGPDAPAAQVALEVPAASEPDGDLDAVLAPHARRMERLNLPRALVASLLEPGARLDADEVALRWAGMPNKNERGLVHEVLEALAEAQFLERTGDGGYVVRKAADG